MLPSESVFCLCSLLLISLHCGEKAKRICQEVWEEVICSSSVSSIQPQVEVPMRQDCFQERGAKCCSRTDCPHAHCSCDQYYINGCLTPAVSLQIAAPSWRSGFRVVRASSLLISDPSAFWAVATQPPTPPALVSSGHVPCSLFPVPPAPVGSLPPAPVCGPVGPSL